MDLAGKWRSIYKYFSSSQDKELGSEHVVVFEQNGDKLIGKSEPHSSGSQLELKLGLDGNIATGTWLERTSPSGNYGGAVFHGAIQLVISDNGKRMAGQWLGFNSDRTKINNGRWVFNKVEE